MKILWGKCVFGQESPHFGSHADPDMDQIRLDGKTRSPGVLVDFAI